MSVDTTTKRSNFRRFVAIGLFLSGFGLPVTGFGMEAHHGVSHAVREAWAHAHAGLGLIFVICAVWHLSLNWRPMLRYLGLKK